MGTLANFDLLSVGVAVAAIGVLGFTVYFNDRKSVTNQAFLFFSIVTAFWGVFTYLEYNVAPDLGLWFLRLSLFCAIGQAYFLYIFFSVFPEREHAFSPLHRFVAVPVVATTALLTLTPYVLGTITRIASNGTIATISNGPIMPVFGLIAVALIVWGLIIFFRKTYAVRGDARRPYIEIQIGTLLTFALIITFNFILPAFFSNAQFVPFGSVFVFPFVAFATYAILRHGFINVKVAATSVLVFILAIVSFGEIIFSDTLSLVIFRSSVFMLVLIFGINLIRGVVREVEQREKIQKLAEGLESSNEQLSEFMSLATHEIRNPATFIKGFAAGALEGDLGELTQKVQDGMQKIFVRANDIIHLGNQYLDKSKLELGKITYEFAPIDLGKLAVDLVNEFQAAAIQQKITIAADIDRSQTYEVHADSGKIKEVVGNLIDNAIKYTEQGSVTVSVSKSERAIAIKIADTGVGIPAEIIPHLFKKFSRADAQKVNLLGSGLGLYIAKTFIDAHHGRIWVESGGKGKGSTFYVELPISQEALPVT